MSRGARRLTRDGWLDEGLVDGLAHTGVVGLDRGFVAGALDGQEGAPSTLAATRKIRQHHKFEDKVVPNTKETDTALQKLRSPLKMHGLRLFESMTTQ